MQDVTEGSLLLHSGSRFHVSAVNLLTARFVPAAENTPTNRVSRHDGRERAPEPHAEEAGPVCSVTFIIPAVLLRLCQVCATRLFSPSL